tara:strand:- start:11357 stop:11599 length:243 start_codon:yes stop_codon:yes gene_type:complete
MFNFLTKLPGPTKEQAVYFTMRNIQLDITNPHMSDDVLYDIVSREYDKIKHNIHSQANWIAFSSNLLLENSKNSINMKWY